MTPLEVLASGLAGTVIAFAGVIIGYSIGTQQTIRTVLKLIFTGRT